MTEGEKLFNAIIKDEGFEVSFLYGNESRSFKTFHQFKKFIDENLEFWQEFDQGQLSAVRSIYQQLDQFLERISSSTDEGEINNIFSQVKSLTNKHVHFVSCTSDVAAFLIREYQRNFKYADAAYHIIFHKSMLGLNDIDYFIGSMDAYSFLDDEFLPEDKIRAEQKYDRIVAKHLSEIERIQNEYDELQDKYKSELNSVINETNNSKSTFDTQTSNQQQSFEDQLKEWKEKVQALEKAYGDLLLLKKPAEYWKALKILYSNQGKSWMKYSFWSAIGFVAILIFLLFTFPEWLKGDFKIDHLKGLIIFTIIISTFSYLIHLFVKLSTSAYHLSRDAEERRQLTFLYLALLKEGAIDPKERDIILQSLFSRADTGLLKTDGAPTMPGNISEKILSKFT